jgi:hypothetical protein
VQPGYDPARLGFVPDLNSDLLGAAVVQQQEGWMLWRAPKTAQDLPHSGERCVYLDPQCSRIRAVSTN